MAGGLKKYGFTYPTSESKCLFFNSLGDTDTKKCVKTTVPDSKHRKLSVNSV